MATISAPVAQQYLHSDTFTINYSVSDGNGSGVKSAVPDIDGQTTLYDGTARVTVANGLTIKLLTELALGTHTFNLNSVDNVDNAATATVTFSIIVTAESIKDEVNQFFAMGAIRNKGVANSLLAKLDSAAKARARGNCNSAANVYRAFINELHAQTGNAVTGTSGKYPDCRRPVLDRTLPVISLRPDCAYRDLAGPESVRPAIEQINTQCD